MSKVLVLDKFVEMGRKEQQAFLDRIEMKIEYTEIAYNETRSQVMLDQMNKLYYYLNLGYGYLKDAKGKRSKN